MIEIELGSFRFVLTLPDWMSAAPESWLSEHQVLIGGLIGFTGVCVSVFSSALLQSRAWKSEREHQVNSLRSALVAELKFIEGAWQTSIDDLTNKEIASDEYALLGRGRADVCFPDLKGKLGILKVDEIQSVIKAYARYNHVHYALGLICSQAESTGEYFAFTKAGSVGARSVLSGAIEDISGAIATLEMTK